MTPDQLLAHLRRLTAALSPRQLASLVAVFAGVVAIVAGSAWWVNAPTFTLLYADLDAESASAVVDRLRAAKVAYQLADGGRTIRVPAERVDELRLDLASQGLPTAGRIGFEVFDRTAFGTTEFLEQVNYRRGLEGELARTIATLSEVAGARVHIAPAKTSLFANERQEAKASVVLRLRNRAPLAPSTVTGIASLVANSVESLRPEAVVIVDTFGRPLSRVGSDDEAASGASPERQRRVEQDLAAQVVALLEPVVGAGHVRVTVSARLDPQSQEETEERWDPATVVRSRQSSTDAAPATIAQGIAGARANAPPGTTTGDAAPPAPPAAAALPAGRTSETTNYEVSRLTRHTIIPQGKLSRLSVAVIVDDERVSSRDEAGQVQVTTRPRTPEALERIQRLVAAAVGLDPGRGDQLTVENIGFGDALPADEPVPSGPAWLAIPRQVAPYAPQALRTVTVLVVALAAILWVLRPMMRAALPAAALPAAAGGGQPARTVAEMEGAIERELDALGPGSEGRRLPVLTRRIARRTEETPEEVARLVRTWLSEEER